METIAINHFAVIVASALAFVLGSLWYGPLFGKAWLRETGISAETAASGNKGKIFGLAFVWTLVMAYNLAFFLGQPTIDVKQGVMYGFATGFGWIAMAIFIVGLFERRSATLMLINGGYMTVALTMMGAVIASWR
jgi:hypothetical protein